MIIDLLATTAYFGMFLIYMLSTLKSLHMMQLESYKNKDYITWLSKNVKPAFKNGVIQFLIMLLAYAIMTLVRVLISVNMTDGLQEAIELSYNVEFVISSLALFVVNGIYIYRMNKEMKSAKKPLVYTARVKRLIFMNFIVLLLLELAFETMFPNKFLQFSFLIATIPINMLISNWFIGPTEGFINKCYINSARRKIKSSKYKNLIRIGITGSYGKTSTKFILQTILSEKYNVLATPESYNTTMGNVRTIREKLKPEHEVFISEMGARNRFDIQEICDFVRPQIGIITSIGEQHLETFKKIENVMKTKAELLEGLTGPRVAVLPIDNQYCKKLYEIYNENTATNNNQMIDWEKIKALYKGERINKNNPNENAPKYSYSLTNTKADVYAKNIHLNELGSNFTVSTKDGEFECTTKLLGEHNIENILGCITIAKHLGLTNEEIKKGVAKVEAVEHRLQILPSANGTIVIDDAFNSNPVGSKMALDVVNNFKGRTKIIITPGMVELGKEEYNLNKEFGRHMAKCVDKAILVGQKRSKPIVEGLREKKFNDMNIYVVKDLAEATKKLAEISKAGDVVLFENDLPDNYNE